MLKTLSLLVFCSLLIACTAAEPKPDPVDTMPDTLIIDTDIHSCLRDPEQPWCIAECTHTEREWC